MPSAPAARTAPRGIDFSKERSGFSTGYSAPKPRVQAPQETPAPVSPPPNFKKVSAAAPTNGPGLFDNSPPATADQIQPGVEVMHDKFGKGKVLSLEGDAPDIKATIFFPSAGQKQLLLKFAKLKVL
jgi:DNA helicase-2/ATP-dependent DNA helicase PcrA